MFPYRFIKGRQAGCLGIGAEGYALAKPQTNPLNDGFYRAGYAVQRSFAPIAGGFYKIGRQLPATDLIGNGLEVQGQLALTRLSRMNG